MTVMVKTMIANGTQEMQKDFALTVNTSKTKMVLAQKMLVVLAEEEAVQVPFFFGTPVVFVF